jgi:general secretion pathway protein A
MYHAHFALREEPFGVSPDQRFFMETEQHREALATLYYAIRQRRGFALLLGRAGLGKTSVLVQLVRRLEGETETAWLPHPYFDRTNVLESILLSLGLTATGSLAQDHRLFYKFLIDTRQAGKTCVVIFDEAQDLSLDTLETIRMLSNFETPTEKLVQIVLAGQPRLASTLAKPECEQIRQRLNVIARLRPLTGREVHDYVGHRLRAAGAFSPEALAAGASSGLFSPDALDAVAAASDGVPRNVNTICFNSLTLAYAVGKNQVGRGEVKEVLHDLDLGSNLTQLPAEPSPGRPVVARPVVAMPVVAMPVPVIPVPMQTAPEDAVAPKPAPASANSVNSLNYAAAIPAPIPGFQTIGFQPIDSSFRSAFIAGSVMLLVAGTFLLRDLL